MVWLSIGKLYGVHNSERFNLARNCLNCWNCWNCGMSERKIGRDATFFLLAFFRGWFLETFLSDCLFRGLINWLHDFGNLCQFSFVPSWSNPNLLSPSLLIFQRFSTEILLSFATVHGRFPAQFFCADCFWNISFYISFSPLSFNLIKNLDLAAMKLIGLPFHAWTENARKMPR